MGVAGMTRCRGWKHGLTVRSRKVRTKCAASVWTDRCLRMQGLLLLDSTPCCLEAQTKSHLLTIPPAKAGRGEELQRSRGMRRCSYCPKTSISDAAARKQPLCSLLAKQNICIQPREAADINRPEHQPISPT